MKYKPLIIILCITLSLVLTGGVALVAVTDDNKMSTQDEIVTPTQDEFTISTENIVPTNCSSSICTTKTDEKFTEDIKSPTITVYTGGKYLLDIANPDANYVSYSISLTATDRDILQRLVMGEAGGEGFIGCCLVAQAIRDTMISDGYKSVEHVRTSMGYQASLYNTPNQDAIDAVNFIFDQGGAAVQHSIIYFYAPALCISGFHESQEFVVEHNGHRFFDRW